MEILRALLKERRIEAHEAGGLLTPGQQVFCLKICSKIIQSQFCIVLLNNETVGNAERTNPNVHVEYGMMLGFNKYILPFQHEDYQLAFNVAGLDTIKYDNQSFKAKAAAAIDQAVLETAQPSTEKTPVSPDVGAYLLTRGAIVTSLDNPGDNAIYQLGAVCGFNLCSAFSGNRYIYYGNFPKLQPSVIAWRVKKLVEIVDDRLSGLDFRVKKGIVTKEQQDLFSTMRQELEIWLLTKNTEDREAVRKLLDGCNVTLSMFTEADVSNEVSKSGMY
jgi:hypothetical protein